MNRGPPLSRYRRNDQIWVGAARNEEMVFIGVPNRWYCYTWLGLARGAHVFQDQSCFVFMVVCCRYLSIYCLKIPTGSLLADLLVKRTRVWLEAIPCKGAIGHSSGR